MNPLTQKDWQIVFLSPWGTTMVMMLVLSAAVALTWSVRGYWRQRLWYRRWGLIGLRAIVLACALLIALQPAIQTGTVTRLPNHVAMLIDVSRSMAIRASEGEPSRLQRAVARAERIRRELSVRDEHIVNWWSFDHAARPVASASRLQLAAGATTDFKQALLTVAQHYKDKNLGGVMIVSDGIDTAHWSRRGITAADEKWLRSIDAPVCAHVLTDTALQDVSLERVGLDDYYFARSSVSVDVDLFAVGINGQSTDVIVKLENTVVARRTVALNSAQKRYKLPLRFMVPHAGRYGLTVEALAVDGEVSRHNNRYQAVLTVLKDRRRILHLAGRPSWDQRFLRTALKRDPNIDLISFYILRTTGSVSAVPTEELSLIPFPTKELFGKAIHSFDVIIFQNFAFAAHQIGEYLPNVVDYVRKGGGLVLIGGDLSYSAAGYGESVLADILPVRLYPNDPGAQAFVDSDEFTPVATTATRSHPIWQNIKSKLPMLAGVNVVAGLAPDSAALIVHPKLKDGTRAAHPIIAVRDVAVGRTMAITTDSLWAWAVADPLGDGDVDPSGGKNVHQVFWNNALAWLSHDDGTELLQLTMPRDHVLPGQRLAIAVKALLPDYRARGGALLRYRVVDIAEGLALQKGELKTDSDGVARLSFVPPSAGLFRVTVEGNVDGRRVSVSDVFVAAVSDVESRRLAAESTLLGRLAAVSGGVMWIGDNRSDSPISRCRFKSPKILSANWQTDKPLWSHFGAFALLLLLLTGEWILRRKWGHF